MFADIRCNRLDWRVQRFCIGLLTEDHDNFTTAPAAFVSAEGAGSAVAAPKTITPAATAP